MATDKASWDVSGSKPAIDLDPSNGQAVRGYRVFYTIRPSGMTDSVFIPMARYTPETVKAAIAEAVRNHNAVTGLSG